MLFTGIICSIFLYVVSYRSYKKVTLQKMSLYCLWMETDRYKNGQLLLKLIIRVTIYKFFYLLIKNEIVCTAYCRLYLLIVCIIVTLYFNFKMDIIHFLNIEQISLINCGVRNNTDVKKANKTYNSTIVQNMPGTVLTFHPTNKSTYFVGTKVGFVVQVGIYLIGFNILLNRNKSSVGILMAKHKIKRVKS